MRDQEIIGLQEAYASIYAQDDVVSEDAQQAVGQALDAAARNPVIQAIGKVIAPVGKGRGTVTKAEHEKNIKKEEVETDLFDYLLEYLVAEGYADTNKAALAIMANMSEEWKQSIVEEVLDEELTGPRAERAREIMATASKGKAKALNRVLKSREGSTAPGGQPSANIKGDGSEQKLPTKRGGGGIRGRAKVTTIGGSKMDQRRGNRATRRAGEEVEDTSDEN